MGTREIVEELAKRGRQLLAVPREAYPFTHNLEADRLLNDLDRDPHAFLLACVMDRQIKAERAWLIPHEIAQRLGTFDLDALSKLSVARVQQLMTKPTPLHRFNEEMSRNFHDAVAMVVDKYGGNAANVWNDTPPSAELVYRFLAFRGIGPKIATMAANILVRHFKTPLRDYYSIDVSVDVHVRRVLARLGLVCRDDSVERIVYRVRGLCPEFPGVIDLPTWEIGRSWCKPTHPSCTGCYVTSLCPKVGIAPDRQPA